VSVCVCLVCVCVCVWNNMMQVDLSDVGEVKWS